jgi:hypothetical protein
MQIIVISKIQRILEEGEISILIAKDTPRINILRMQLHSTTIPYNYLTIILETVWDAVP